MMPLEALEVAERIAETILYQFGTEVTYSKIVAYTDSYVAALANHLTPIETAGMYEYIRVLTESAVVQITIKPVRFYATN